MKRASYKYLLLLLIAFPFCSSAQIFTPGKGEDSIPVTPNIAPYRTIAKISLFAPLENENNIRLSIEVTLNNYLSIEPEIGVIFNNSVTGNKLNTDMVNAEGRLGLRYYFPERIITGLYTGALASFSTDNYGTGLIRNFHPANPDSAFFDFSNPAQYQENDYALYGILGLQPVISRHINFDISGGIGCLAQQIITRYNPNAPVGANMPSNSLVYKLSGIVSLKFGYIF